MVRSAGRAISWLSWPIHCLDTYICSPTSPSTHYTRHTPSRPGYDFFTALLALRPYTFLPYALVSCGNLFYTACGPNSIAKAPSELQVTLGLRLISVLSKSWCASLIPVNSHLKTQVSIKIKIGTWNWTWLKLMIKLKLDFEIRVRNLWPNLFIWNQFEKELEFQNLKLMKGYP